VSDGPIDQSSPGPRPRGEPDSAGLSDEDSRLTNSARALGLGALLSGSRQAVEGIEEDIETLGVRTDLDRPLSWEQRRSALAASDNVLRRVAATEVIGSEFEFRLRIGRRSTEPRFPDQRVQLWQELAQSRQPVPIAYAWLRLLMAEEDSLLAASASGALSHWRRPAGSRDSDIPRALLAARANVAAMAEDSDDLTSAVAQASAGVPSGRALTEEYGKRASKEPRKAPISLMIHGTHAFTGRWWFPGGDFHRYVKANICPNLYDLPDTFWWSGRYTAKDRRRAAEMLAGWLDAKGGPEVDLVFAHSYGGAVALQATKHGLRMKTAVLLSTPVSNYEVEWRNIDRAVSLRIHCDLVLLAARTKQRFTANVEEHWLDSWFVQHGMSHDPDAWAAGGWARTLGLG
jgi:hypothetical protein